MALTMDVEPTPAQLAINIPSGGEAAAVRSAMYALCSELTGSPFDQTEGSSLATSLAELVQLVESLPYEVALPELTLAALDKQLNDGSLCRRQYRRVIRSG